MSPRATFLLLLLANLAFFGWAALIDVAPEPTPSDSIANLPQLKLLSEVRGKRSSAAAASVGSGAPAASGSTSSAAKGAAVSAGSQSRSAAPAEAASTPVTLAGAEHAATAAAGPAIAGASRRCITIGPFADPERAREASDVLRERGFTPRGRSAVSGLSQGYWVFVGGFTSPADETNVLHRLETNGISDAKAMPASTAGRRISVGLFNALDGAERRARAVRRLGLDAQVEPRATGEAHWVDVDLDSSSQSLPAEGLLSLEEPGSRLEIKECPAPDRGAGPRTPATAGRPRPG